VKSYETNKSTIFSKMMGSSQFVLSSQLYAFLCILFSLTLLKAAPDGQDAKYLERVNSFDQKVIANAEKTAWEKDMY
jgi:hypothetical protein